MKVGVSKSHIIVASGALKDILYHPMDDNLPVRQLHRLVIGNRAYGRVNYCQSLRKALEGMVDKHVQVILLASGSMLHLVAIKETETGMCNKESEQHCIGAQKIGFALAGLALLGAMPFGLYLGVKAGIIYSLIASLCVGKHFRDNVFLRKEACSFID